MNTGRSHRYLISRLTVISTGLLAFGALGGCVAGERPEDPTVESPASAENSKACWGSRDIEGFGSATVSIRRVWQDYPGETMQQASQRTRENARRAAWGSAYTEARSVCRGSSYKVHGVANLCYKTPGFSSYVNNDTFECWIPTDTESWTCIVNVVVPCNYSFTGMDPCAGVECPPGTECSGGECQDVCGDIECPAGSGLDAECQCYPVDPCASVFCPPGSTCSAGICSPVDPCANVVCPVGSSCVSGQCQSLDPCANVVCGFGQTCVNGQCLASGCTSDFDCPLGQYCWGAGSGVGYCAGGGQTCVLDGVCSSGETCACDAACCTGGGGGAGSGPGGSCGWDGGSSISYGDCHACGGSVTWSSDAGAFVCEGMTTS